MQREVRRPHDHVLHTKEQLAPFSANKHINQCLPSRVPKYLRKLFFGLFSRFLATGRLLDIPRIYNYFSYIIVE